MEAESINNLLKEDTKLWKSSFCSEAVSDGVNEMCSGWKRIRPSAEYDLTKTRPRGKRRPAATQTVTSTDDDKVPVKYPYMSGELDENFSYSYKGGLSSRANVNSVAFYSEHPDAEADVCRVQPRFHQQTIRLEPPTPPRSRSRAQLGVCRAELVRILAPLQSRPDLLMEQLALQNRLQTLSLAAFPVLGRIGVLGVKSDGQAHSKSTPALPSTHLHHLQPQQHSTRKGPYPKPSKLESRSQKLANFMDPENYIQREHVSKSQLSPSKYSALPQEGGSSIGASPSVACAEHQMPIFIPASPAMSRDSRENTRLHPLPYKTEDGSLRHTPSTQTGSTLHCPQPSYLSPKTLKFRTFF